MNKRPLIALSLLGATALVLSAGRIGDVRAQDPAPATAESLVPQSQQQPAMPQSTDASVGTVMSYQGQLQKSGGAYTGACNFQFSLWDAATGGAQKGSTITKNATAVANGLFSVELDFGNQFTGEARWLQTAVQCAGDLAFTTLTPRQPQNAVPYAMGIRPGTPVSASNFVLVNGNKRLDISTGGSIDIQSPTDFLYIHSRLSGYGCLENCQGAVFLQPFGGRVGVGTNNPATTLDVNGTARSRIVEITGGSDLAECFSQADGTVAEPGTVMLIDADHPGHIKPSARAYDRKVAGIVSGAGDLRPGLTLHQEGVAEGDTVMAIAGRVYVKAEALSGPIEPGDLLTTSDIPGTAMKASDDARSHGAVIGKAMTGLESGTGLVLVIVNLQ